MIDFQVEYIRPPSYEAAYETFQTFLANKKIPYYYAGGTEFISRARRNEIEPDVIIDLKGIQEMFVLKKDEEKLIIGANNSLTTIAEKNDFPLLTELIRGIATRTARNKITIGGNVMSHLPYREAILPFLLAESELIIVGESGLVKRNIVDIYNKKITLDKGEFILQIETKKDYISAPYFYAKRTRQSKVNYPVATVASMYKNNKYQIAFSGLTEQAFRCKKVEEQLNDSKLSSAARVNKVIDRLSAAMIDDMEASSSFRIFALEILLKKIVTEMEGDQVGI